MNAGKYDMLRALSSQPLRLRPLRLSELTFRVYDDDLLCCNSGEWEYRLTCADDRPLTTKISGRHTCIWSDSGMRTGDWLLQ